MSPTRAERPPRAAGADGVAASVAGASLARSGGAGTGGAAGPGVGVPIRPYGRPRLVRGIFPAALVGGLALSCGVALTTTAGWLIVKAAERPQILTLLAAIVLVRAFGIARPALRYVERVRSHDAALAYLAEERAETYRRLIPLTPARLGRRSRGDILAGVVDDLDDIAYAQVRVVVPLVALAVTGLLATFVTALFLYPAIPVVLSQIGCTLLVAWGEFHVERRAHRAVVAARAEVSRLTTLTTSHAAELAAIGAGPQALAWLDAAQRDLSAALVRQGRGRAVGVAAMPVLTVGHAIVMAAVCAPWVPALSPAIAAFLVLVPVAMGEVVAGIPDAVGALARARSAGRRLDRLLGQLPAVKNAVEAVDPVEAVGHEPSIPASAAGSTPESESGGGGQPESAPLLALNSVTASWDGQRAALPRLSYCFPAGRRVAVVGPNGSGKSTLLAVLSRHLDPDGGSYTFDGVDVTKLPLPRTRERLAVVGDEPHVFSTTLRENLRFARPNAADADLEQALRLAGLQGWYAALPDGLDTALGASARGVSGGERARLAIARALLSKRPVLLLDEPVAHLDHPTAMAVLADLWEATGGRTVVLVAHRPEGIEAVDEVLRLGRPDHAAAPPVSGPR